MTLTLPAFCAPLLEPGDLICGTNNLITLFNSLSAPCPICVGIRQAVCQKFLTQAGTHTGAPGLARSNQKSDPCELLGTTRLRPSELACIGDEIRDADAARAVGVAFIGVAWGYTHPAALQPHSARPLLPSLAGLPGVLADFT